MARKPRIEFPGAFYHVIARGNRRQVIFHDTADRHTYLERLEHYRQRYHLTVHAYVLMANHVHLLLETREVPLAKFMQALQFTYTRYYNRRYATSGHLFQGRYQAIVCDRDAYLVELVRYVHLNPGRLKRPVDPWRYPWSSHRAYLGEAGPVKVETAVVLGQFGNHVGRARHAYRRFMADGAGRGHEAQYYATVDQRLLGDEVFIEAVDQKTGRGREIERARRPVVFARLIRAVAQQQGVEASGLLGPGRQRAGVGARARAMLVYLGREWSQVRTKELGRQLHRDPSIISRLYWWYVANRDLKAEAKLAKVLER